MEPKHRALPVGCRFRPTDCEISNYFLKKKALNQTMKARIVPEECHDIFSRHPRDLPGNPREKHLYFFCRKRTNQDTNNGSHNTWRPIGEETNVLDPKQNGELVGIKRSFTLVEQEEESNDIFLSDEEEPPRYNWFLDEISLPLTIAETDWVFCHVFRKKIVPEVVDFPLIESESEDEDEDKESIVTDSMDLLRETDETVLPPSPSPP